MIPDGLLNEIPDLYADQLAKINTKYISQIARTIGRLGKMKPEDFHKVQQLYRYGADYDKMVSDLSKLTNKTIDDIYVLMNETAKSSYSDMEALARMRGMPILPYAENIPLQQTVLAMAQQTAGALRNLSNTSVVGYVVRDLNGNVTFKGLEAVYKDTIDDAIRELAMGVSDFPKVMRGTLNSLADSGIRTVDYASGVSRRLDSAVRMNILDGARDVYQGVQDQVGREIGCDGIEISAHAGCAPDHLPYQGRQYTEKEIEKIQNILDRPIGMSNCRHMMYRIILGISKPAYSEEDLKELKNLSTQKINYDDKDYTIYEATQMQRKIETEVRRSQDRATLSKLAGDDTGKMIEQQRTQQLVQKYKELSTIFGLPFKFERMGKLIK